MKRTPSTLIASLAALAIAGAASFADAPVNLIKNGSAEDATGNVIAGWSWTPGSITPEQGVGGVSNDAFEGKNSFRIAMTQPVGANVWFVQGFSLPPTTKSFQVIFSAKQKTDAARTQWAVPGVGCYFNDKAGQWMYYQYLRNVDPSDKWTTFTNTVNVPIGATSVGLRLAVGSQGVIEALFDDIRVYPSDSYANSLINADIEDGTLAWVVKRTACNDKQAVADVAKDGADGKQSLHLGSTDTLNPVHVSWSQMVQTTGGITSYDISIKGKVVDGAGANHPDATVGYAFLNEKRREIGYMPFGVLTGKTWAPYTTKVAVPPDTQFIEVRLCLDGTGLTDAYFDSIKIVPAK
ncbi:MAG TPA: hypothetical protein VGK19_19370 [Capsulimonadaceae bacterium]|jgi:hypothetical protein